MTASAEALPLLKRWKARIHIHRDAVRKLCSFLMYWGPVLILGVHVAERATYYFERRVAPFPDGFPVSEAVVIVICVLVLIELVPKAIAEGLEAVGVQADLGDRLLKNQEQTERLNNNLENAVAPIRLDLAEMARAVTVTSNQLSLSQRIWCLGEQRIALVEKAVHLFEVVDSPARPTLMRTLVNAYTDRVLGDLVDEHEVTFPYNLVQDERWKETIDLLQTSLDASTCAEYDTFWSTNKGMWYLAGHSLLARRPLRVRRLFVLRKCDRDRHQANARSAVLEALFHSSLGVDVRLVELEAFQAAIDGWRDPKPDMLMIYDGPTPQTGGRGNRLAAGFMTLNHRAEPLRFSDEKAMRFILSPAGVTHLAEVYQKIFTADASRTCKEHCKRFEISISDRIADAWWNARSTLVTKAGLGFLAWSNVEEQWRRLAAPCLKH